MKNHDTPRRKTGSTPQMHWWSNGTDLDVPLMDLLVEGRDTTGAQCLALIAKRSSGLHPHVVAWAGTGRLSEDPAHHDAPTGLSEEVFLTAQAASEVLDRIETGRGTRLARAVPIVFEGRVGAALYMEHCAAGPAGTSPRCPPQAQGLVARIEKLLKDSKAAQILTADEKQHASRETDGQDGVMLGRSPAMLRCFDEIKKVAATDYVVMLSGESGTGKELAARRIHAMSKRADKPFLAVNCSALPGSLVESELFGHVKGAFTGSLGTRLGLIEEAHKGTFFMDEIGELEPAVQAKLLRVIQERRIKPVGSNTFRQFDVRLVCATNRNLDRDMANGSFRADLFFRLHQIEIDLPPLRDRGSDLAMLIRHFLRKHAEQIGIQAPLLRPDALARMKAYTWPGNVRELENAIVQVLVRHRPREPITVDMLSEKIQSSSLSRTPAPRSIHKAREDFERRFIAEALEKNSGNTARTARQIGLSRQGLSQKLKKLNLNFKC